MPTAKWRTVGFISHAVQEIGKGFDDILPGLDSGGAGWRIIQVRPSLERKRGRDMRGRNKVPAAVVSREEDEEYQRRSKRSANMARAN